MLLICFIGYLPKVVSFTICIGFTVVKISTLYVLLNPVTNERQSKGTTELIHVLYACMFFYISALDFQNVQTGSSTRNYYREDFS